MRGLSDGLREATAGLGLLGYPIPYPYSGAGEVDDEAVGSSSSETTFTYYGNYTNEEVNASDVYNYCLLYTSDAADE